MLKIGLLAPFEEPVPPRKYGGTELVVYNLAEELTRLGHDVTLFASRDSTTSAKLYPCVDKAIRVLPEARNQVTRTALNYLGLAKAVVEIRNNHFDIIHNHFGWQLLLLKDLIDFPIVTTLHGTLLEPTEQYMHGIFKKGPFISISNAQRRHGPNFEYVATVYNGIQLERFEFNDKPDNYLLFLGRMNPQKGPEYAIQIAKQTKQKLIIAGKIDPVDQAYFEQTVKPLINNKQIVFVGEVGHSKKVALLKRAKALLSPIQWDEPFGLTNIEAMAYGTPVLTIGRGSLPEIIEDGVTGYLCKTVKDIAAKVPYIDKLDRVACRQAVEKKFSARQMALNYVAAYERVIGQQRR